MPEGVPAEQNPSENVSGDCRDLRDKCEDGRKIHLPGARHPASGIRGSDMSRVYEDMGGIMPVEAAEKWFARLMSPDCEMAEDRKSVVQGKSVLVRVDLGGGGISKQKK